MSAHHEVSYADGARQLYGFMSPRRRRQFLLLVALILVGAVAELLTIATLMVFLSLLAGGTSAATGEWNLYAFTVAVPWTLEQQIYACAILFALLVLVAGAVRLVLTWATQQFAFFLGHEIATEIQRRLLLQPYSFHTANNSSELLASVEKVEVLVHNILLPLIQSIAAAAISMVIIATLIRIEPVVATGAAAAVVGIYLLISAVSSKRLRRNSIASSTSFNQRLKVVQESLGGVRDVIVDGSHGVFLQAFRDADRRLAEARIATAFISAAPRFLIESAGLLAFTAITLVLVQRHGGLPAALPVLGAIALGSLRLLPFLQQLYQGWTMMSGNRADAEQVLRLLRLPLPADDAGTLEALPLNSGICFENVSFTYPGSTRPALRDVDLVVPKGGRVALTGRSGSGKTTLADLLMGLLEPTAGRIAVDGEELDRHSRRRWLRSIAHVPQSIFLADTSIARNIAFGVREEDIDLSRIQRAARTAQLDELIALLPGGFDTLVGERGVRLSGGERQRVGIARAIYKDAPVLVLDEATSALDQATESAVLDALHEDAGASRTIVIISHRPSTIANCDLAVGLERGQIVGVRSGDPASSSVANQSGRRSP